MDRGIVDGGVLRISEEVVDALRDGTPVVALESSLIAQGLPPPHNMETALAAEAAIREAGAVPATIVVDAGHLLVGAGPEVLQRLADPDLRAAKSASPDLGPLLAAGTLASTTVSATMRIARWAGIELFATGGIGGVHRGAARTFDVSSDIDELASTPVAVVCSGAKSILDLPATVELLETRRVPVIGLGVREFPAFYSSSSGLALRHSVAGPDEAAKVIDAHFSIPGAAGILIVQPPPEDLALDANDVERWTGTALEEAETAGVRGGALTPFVLARLAAISGGVTLRTNVAMIVSNARSAAEVAAARAGRGAR